MGQNRSLPSQAGRYQMVLGPDDQVQIHAGDEVNGSDPVDQNMRLEVRDWRSSMRSFHLSIEDQPLDGPFNGEIDWVDDTVRFAFNMPGTYAGGQVDLLRRTRQLFEENGPLGITSKHFGEEAVNAALANIERPKGVRRKWNRSSVDLYGCKGYWLSRILTGDNTIVFRFTADSDETALLVVDSNNPSFREFCFRAPNGPLNLVGFMRLIMLPLRICMRIQSWTALYEKQKAEFGEEIDAIMKNAENESENAADSCPDQTKGTKWWQHLLSLAASIKQRKVSEKERQQMHDEAKLKGSFASATAESSKGNRHVNSWTTEPDNDGDSKRLALALTEKEDTEFLEYILVPKEDDVLSKEKIRDELQQPDKQGRRHETQQDAGLVSEHSGNASKPSNATGPSEDNLAFTKHLASHNLLDSTPPHSFTMMPLPEYRRSSSEPPSFVCSPDFQAPLRSYFSSPGRALSPARDFDTDHDEQDQASGLGTPVINMTPREGLTSYHQPGNEEYDSTEGAMSSESRSQSSVADESLVCLQDGSARSDHRSPSRTPERASQGSILSSDSMLTEVVVAAEPDVDPHTEAKKTTRPRCHRQKLKKMYQRRQMRLEEAKARKASRRAPDSCEETSQPAAAQETAASDVQSWPDKNQLVDAAPTPTPPAPSSKSAKKKKKKNKKGNNRVPGTTATVAVTLSSDDDTQSSTPLEDQSCEEDPVTPKATPPKLSSFPKSTEAQLSPSSSVAASQPSEYSSRSPSPHRSASAVQAEKSLSPSAVTVVESSHDTAVFARLAAGSGSSSSGVLAAEGVSEYRSTPTPAPRPRTVIPPGDALGSFAATPVATICHDAHTSQAQVAIPSSEVTRAFPSRDISSTATTATAPSEDAHATLPTQTADEPPRVIHNPAGKPTCGFFWDLTYHGFTCAMAGCTKQCATWDSQSCICPGCGPLSRVRYCSKEHMWAAIRTHWSWCGFLTFKEFCVKSSVPPDMAVGPPMLPSINSWETPERYRQSVWFTTARMQGDYFIFADWDDQVAMGASPGSNRGRCSPRVLCVVRFDDPLEKDQFRRCLAVCLFMSLEVQMLVNYLFRLVRDNLRKAGLWNSKMDAVLRLQFRLELGITIDRGYTGQRHACETEWTGQNLRHCRDPICEAETPSLLGDPGSWGRGYRHLCDYMESMHWLLRAHRTTHPTVHSVVARTYGEGWGPDVVEEDRRFFRRGEGWDGAGTGPMEFEGSEG